jgi:hypothetical protein
LCLWILSIVWCLKNKKLKIIDKRLKPEQIKTQTSTNKSHRDQLQTAEQTYLGTHAHKHLKPEKTQVAISDTATHKSQHTKGGKIPIQNKQTWENTQFAHEPRTYNKQLYSVSETGSVSVIR